MKKPRIAGLCVVRLEGLEPPTPGLEVRCLYPIELQTLFVEYLLPDIWG